MDKCELCGREMVLTFHHLIPRCMHKNKWFRKNFTKEEMGKGIYICEHDCHPEIHRYIGSKDMGQYFNTLESLKAHPMVSKYIIWVKKQS